ncbi:Serine carboxypeptidase-like 42 isoform 1 [Hibiscus syriacus]|uniref:Serine carboxypeptidase-like 42 isoform 1 n=1 Tax=Hibiscus syriacus TaxID=106335 RepID=A0A6A3D0V9_HIBSY|nr:Serine carboxypeptidase-like 42 isoform 1 [Hibiscus syriacus]
MSTAMMIQYGHSSGKYLSKSSERASRCQSNSRGSCRRRFDELNEKNVVLWNAMLGGLVQNGCAYTDEVLVLFSQMNRSDSHPDEFTYTSILSSCATLGCLEIGRQFHGFIIKNKFASNLFVANALVDMYAKSGALEDARKQFEIIKDRDNSLEEGKQVHFLAVKSSLDKSLYAISSLIDMYAKSGAIGDADKVLYDMPQWSVVSMNSMIVGYEPNDLDRAVILLKDMQVDGLKPSEVTYTSLLDAYAGNLFEEFKNRESAVVWTALISGHTQNDCNEEALRFFRDMRSCNVLPGQATFVSVLRAFAVLSSLQVGRQIHALVYNTDYVSDELTTSALVDMNAKCGEVKCSVQVFNEMNSKNGISCWNSMIFGFAKNSYAEDALKIFFEMKQTHGMPDEATILFGVQTLLIGVLKF